MPNYFIHFNLDSATIDVNIHPTKTEIKFENEQPIWQILLAAVRETLAKSSAIPMIDFDTEDSIDIPVYNPEKKISGNEPPKVQIRSEYNPFKREATPSDTRPSFDWTELYQSFEADRSAVLPDEEVVEKKIGSATPIEKEIVEKPVQSAEEKVLFANTAVQPVTKPCFQYKNRYLVTTLKSGMAIIDQHRAHLQILFEQYQKSIRQQKAASQQMLFPAIVDFTPAEETILPLLLEDLSYSGFDLSNLGGGSYSINGIPDGMEGVDCVTLLKDIVAKAIDTGCKGNEEIGDMIAFSLASAQAIPAGKVLSAEEMDHLLASLFLCSNMNLTPDGKTILSMLTDDELENRFH